MTRLNLTPITETAQALELSDDELGQLCELAIIAAVAIEETADTLERVYPTSPSVERLRKHAEDARTLQHRLSLRAK